MKLHTFILRGGTYMKKTASALLIAMSVLICATACGKKSGDEDTTTRKAGTEKPTATSLASGKPATGQSVADEPSTAESVTEEYTSKPIVDRQIIDRTNSDVNALLRLYKSILKNESTFFDTDNNKSITIQQLEESFAPQLSLSEFSIIDLDYDNLPEVVLAFKSSPTEYGFSYVQYCTILHYQNNNVYSYSLPHRAFEELKVDGTFSWAGSASRHGFGKITFNKTITENVDLIDKYTYCDAHNDIYVINYQPATEAEFKLEQNYELLKPNVAWFEYTAINIDFYF